MKRIFGILLILLLLFCGCARVRTPYLLYFTVFLAYLCARANSTEAKRIGATAHFAFRSLAPKVGGYMSKLNGL